MLKLNRSSIQKRTDAPAARALAASARRPGAVTRMVLWIKQRLRGASSEQGSIHKTSTLSTSQLKLVREGLASVLDQHPEARTVMRFVRALEHGLRKKGRHALDQLPVELVRRAMDQLDAVGVDWSHEGLSILRAKAALAIAERDRVASRRQTAHTLAEYSEVEVEEASVTTFMAVSEEWERSFPAPLDALPPEEPSRPT